MSLTVSRSTSIMDSYDAPMLDYSGDTDVHMHTTLSSPKPWIHSETIMEEDLHPIHLSDQFLSHGPQQDVEVDMDDYFNENVEYEMADGEIPVPDTELVDIDVFDAPREETFPVHPPISLSTDITVQDISEKTSEAHFPSSDSGIASDHVPGPAGLETPYSQAAEPERLTPSFPQAQISESTDTLTSDQPIAIVTPHASDTVSGAVTEDPIADVSAEAIADGTSNSLDINQPLEQKNVQDGSTAERATVEENSRQPEIQNDSVREDVPEHDEEIDFPGEAPDGTGAVESHEAGEDDSDPHEISEGVYIEPPPPVLLELPSSSNQPVCTLFNALHDLETEASSTEGAYTVLFQSRPILYYETLNDVFEALRQEERVQSITEFVEGEMIIDAYDLGLLVSEDNVNAREVSLHDLNVLHHGLGFTGPLRLQLRTALPRFILRYRSLQHQTTRGDVATAASRSAENSDDQTSAIPAVDDQEVTDREATNEGRSEGFTEGGAEHENAGSISYSHADGQDGEAEHEEEAYEEYADAQEYFHTSEDADTREVNQVVANDEPQSVLEVDVIHEGSTGPELTEDPECDELRENEVSGNAEAAGPITTPSTHAKDTIVPNPESDAGRTDPIETLLAEGQSAQLGVTEENQTSNTDFSGDFSGAGSDLEDEQGFDAFTENDNTGEDLTEPAEDRSNPIGLGDALELGAVGHDDTRGHNALKAQTTTPSGDIPEIADLRHRTEEDDENADTWELDDGYGAWDETFDGDDLDTALAGEQDSASTGSSTLSGKTASIASKRSFGEVEVEESESLVEQSSWQSPKKTRMR
ncbi:hypothetical protein EI94DRAFT_1825195 [Lactarius quietus]|nr:hypothetical protein EI94DRAFT_1825195 [Lactarius quietus]